MTHAIVLVDAERSAMREMGAALAAIDGVREVFSVSGEWDFVAIVEVSATEGLASVVSDQVGSMPGVTKTHTMVAFEAFPPQGAGGSGQAD